MGDGLRGGEQQQHFHLNVNPTLNMSRRKAREASLINRGKTFSPDV